MAINDIVFYPKQTEDYRDATTGGDLNDITFKPSYGCVVSVRDAGTPGGELVGASFDGNNVVFGSDGGGSGKKNKYPIIGGFHIIGMVGGDD